MSIRYFCHTHAPRFPQLRCMTESVLRFDKTAGFTIVCPDEQTTELAHSLDMSEDFDIVGMREMQDECLPRFSYWHLSQSRNPRDFSWTQQAIMPWWMLTRSVSETLVYIDDDIQWLQPLRPVLDAMPQSAFVGISEHHYPTGRENKSAGRFNNGLCIWRNTPEALTFADGWADRTIAEMSPDRGYEQGELTNWPEWLGDKCWIMPKSTNVGPWRLAKITGNPPALEDGTLVQSFHHHETRPHPGNNSFTIKGQVWNYTNYQIMPETLKSIHEPYGRMIEEYL